MKKNISLISIILAAAAQTAFANGVEKTLPADAHNAQVKSVALGYQQVGEKCDNDPGIEIPYSS